MDSSRLKLEFYDLVAIILPGLLAFCEGWILLRGWTEFTIKINQISGNGLLLLLAAAFTLGHLTQELGRTAVRATKGERYLRDVRDSFWKSAKAQLVRDAIKKELGVPIPDVDAAFDYCLTRLRDHFPKRDIFAANSDLCRSFALLSALAVIPAGRIAFHDTSPLLQSLQLFALLSSFLFVAGALAWLRMVRFRELAEITVFHAYMALTAEPMGNGK